MKKLIALIIFGIAFGLLEAIVVVYLHQILGVKLVYTPSDYLTLLNLKFIAFILPKHPILLNARLTSIEMLREFSTIIMLLSVAYLAGKNIRQYIGSFLVAFAFWDIFYYVFLRFLIGWPASLFSPDIFFLLPVPWVGPVVTPIIISLIMAIIGVRIYIQE